MNIHTTPATAGAMAYGQISSERYAPDSLFHRARRGRVATIMNIANTNARRLG